MVRDFGSGMGWLEMSGGILFTSIPNVSSEQDLIHLKQRLVSSPEICEKITSLKTAIINQI